LEEPVLSADLVIVGAGSAGCVLAARLSEDASCEVALLEAGAEDHSFAAHQPSQWPLLGDSAGNWGHSTSLQAGYKLRSIPGPRGKVLGGTSSINITIYIRGDPRDFDHRNGLGNEGWAWSDVLPYLIKSEDQQRGASSLHGVGGPLAVSDQVSRRPLSRAFVDAAVACGHRRNPDFQGEYRDGAGPYQVTMRAGQRCSTATAYPAPARERPNLRTITRARALHIVMEGGRAVGVDYIDGTGVRRIEARRAVVVSAGAIDSPKLLMLSGIGEPAQLEPHGIVVRCALPGVGANLCDHPGSPLVLALRQPVQALPTSIHVEAGLFMNSGVLNDGFAADLQFFMVPSAPPSVAVQGPTRAMAIRVQACRPKSRGRLMLRSNDPLDAPVIDPGHLMHRDDVALQIEGLRAARAISLELPLRQHIAREPSPGPAAIDDASREAAVRATSTCLYHPVGTCRMGRGADAVVDAQLRVRGVRALRVVAASVMPQITSGNTNAPTIMIAEKAAAMLQAKQ
jgi:choline dehydrogenase